MIIKKQFDREYKGSPCPVADSVSLTIPDMGLTMKQLLINHTRNIESDVYLRQEVDLEGEEVPNFMDLNDVLERREELKRRAAEVKAAVEAERKAAREKAAKEKIVPPTPSKSAKKPVEPDEQSE